MALNHPKAKRVLISTKIQSVNEINNRNIRDELSSELTYLLYREGYPAEWDGEIFTKVMAQVETSRNTINYS